MKHLFPSSVARRAMLAASVSTAVLMVAAGSASAQEIQVKPGETRALTKQAKAIDGVSVKSGTLTASDVEIKRTAAKAAAATIEDGGRIELARSKVSSADAALAATVNGTNQTNFVIGDKSQVEGSKGPLLNVTRGAQGGAGIVDLVISGDAKAKGDINDTGTKTTGYTDVRIDNARFDGGVSGVRTLSLANGATWGVGAKADLASLVVGPGVGTVETAKDATIAAPISGTGNLVKRGAGALTLTGNSSFAGLTTVAAGPLLVNGRLPSAVTVTNGGVIGGTGRIGTLMVSRGGIVAPGANGIGTLSVDGNVTLASGAIYRAEIGEQGRSDLLAATGRAAIDGSTIAIAPASGVVAIPVGEYTVLTAAGGVDGRFATISGAENVPFMTPSLNYAPQAVTLNLARNNVAFASVAANPDQAAVATAIEAGGAGTVLYRTVTGLTRAAVPGSFEALAGTAHASTSTALIDQSQKVGELVLGRLRQAYRTDAALFASAPNTQTHNGIAVWGQALGAWSSPRRAAAGAGFSRRSMGFITGVDAQAGDWRVGAAYSHGWTNLNFDSGSLSRVQSDTVAAYAGGLLGPVHLGVGGTYGWHRIRTTRHLAIPGLTNDLSAGYKARSFQAFGEASVPVYVGGATVEPFASLNHVRLTTNAFSEAGGVGALRGEENKRHVTYTNLGLRGSIDLGVVTPYASAAWQHAYGDRASPRPLAFVDSGTSFLVRGTPIARNSAAIEAGLQANVLPRGSFNISYVGNLSKQWKDNGLKLGFSYGF